MRSGREKAALPVRTGRYRPELDGIRGVGIAIVVIAHLGAPVLGWPGVLLFFVLSGYLITSLLIQERERTGRVDIRAFWMRRARRLFPALAVLLAFLAVTGLATHRDIIATALYVANWQRVTEPMGPLDHAWSLGIEEQFYVAWPLVAGLLLHRRAPALLAALVVAITLWRFALPPERAMWGTDARADALLAGALLALRPLRLPAWSAIPAIIVLVVLGMVLPFDAATRLGLSLGLIASVVIVAAAPGWLAFRPLVWLGGISYALYLWNYPIVVLVPAPWPVLLVLSLIAAWISTRYVEGPFRLRLGDRLERGRDPGPLATRRGLEPPHLGRGVGAEVPRNPGESTGRASA